MRKTILLSILLLAGRLSAAAATPDYWRSDSVKVVRLLAKAARLPSDTCRMTWFARQLCGLPYVAKTLEKNSDERLVVNLRQLDCTTFVETVLALARCSAGGKRSFADYCDELRRLRYRGGEVDYVNRLHYFTSWIEENAARGAVEDIQAPVPPFTATQTVRASYMTTHTDTYPMLHGRADRVARIRLMEDTITGRTYRYIPKTQLADSRLLRATVRDGDIIVILTSKKGLDTSHIGIAVWHSDGLHMINASSVHHKVVEEPKLLSVYMAGHPSQTGIRIVRPR